MSKEKQIEEKHELSVSIYMSGYGLLRKDCDDIAEQLYSEGYRKQSEGEWKKIYDKAPRYVCTACNHLFNNKSYKFCPECGAKMKGGAE